MGGERALTEVRLGECMVLSVYACMGRPSQRERWVACMYDVGELVQPREGREQKADREERESERGLVAGQSPLRCYFLYSRRPSLQPNTPSRGLHPDNYVIPLVPLPFPF